MNYDPEIFKRDLDNVLMEIRTMLVEKNESYGDAALNPMNIFTDLGAEDQIKVRMNDKINRLIARKEYAGEDTKKDLLGYLILERILVKRTGENK